MNEGKTASEILETHLKMCIQSVETLPVKNADDGGSSVSFGLKDIYYD